MFKAKDQFCGECALAMRRFIGHEEGVESIAVENKMIAVVFNPAKMPEERLDQLTNRRIFRRVASEAYSGQGIPISGRHDQYPGEKTMESCYDTFTTLLE